MAEYDHFASYLYRQILWYQTCPGFSIFFQLYNLEEWLDEKGYAQDIMPVLQQAAEPII